MRVSALLFLSLSCSAETCGGTSTFTSPDGAVANDAARECPECFGRAYCGDAGPPVCKGLECGQLDCGGGTSTSLSGVVYAPDGKTPLAHALVYVPNADLAPLSVGPTCDTSCGLVPSGDALTFAFSDSKGAFTVPNVPAGFNIPVIIEVGPWRRRAMIPEVKMCVTTPLPATLTSLPATRNDGDIPRTAVVTGGCDAVACVLPKLGVAAKEFGTSSLGMERVVLYGGADGNGPPGLQPATTLWDDAKELSKFDTVILSSECGSHPENKTKASALQAFADAGGRVIMSGDQVTWMRDVVSGWNGVATWGGESGHEPDRVAPLLPWKSDLVAWLIAVGASTSETLTLIGKTYLAGTTTPAATSWVIDTGPTTTHVFTFGTPLGKTACSQAAYFGMNVSADTVDTTYPAGCGTTLSAQEKLFAYVLFDRETCAPPPRPPPPNPPPPVPCCECP